MAKRRVLMVYKRSAYIRYRVSDKTSEALKGPLLRGYAEVLKRSHWNHYEAMSRVRRALEAEGFQVTQALRSELASYRFVDGHYQLVVAVGGDGTFLDASHLTRGVPLLGVNSDPDRSVARFSGCDWRDFPLTLGKYLSGALRPLPLARLEFKINGKKQPWLVMNDMLVAAASPAGTSRYLLRIGSRQEEQISSGLWISSAAGSTAAIYSAGGKAIPIRSRAFQFLVREVYVRKFGKRKLVRGVLGPKSRIEVVSYMKEGGIYVDGSSVQMPFCLGDKLEVSLSAPPLKVIGLKF